MQPDTSNPTAAPSPAAGAPPQPGAAWASGLPPIPPLIQRAQAAFRRDLPELMKTHEGQWVAYHGDQRMGFARSKPKLVQECLRRGIPDDEFVVRGVGPEMPEDDERLV
jgi:hypothetical protein